MQHRKFLSLLVVVSLMLGLVGPAVAQPAQKVQAQDVHIQSISLESNPTIYSVTSTSGSSPNFYVTFNHTTGSGTDRLLLVGVSWNSATNNSYITSVTFTPSGGSASTLVQAITQVSSWAYRFSAIYYLANPPSATAGAIRINFANSIANGVVAGAANYAGVDTTTPIGPGKGADLVSASTSVTLDWLVGDELVFDNVFVGGSTTGATPGDGQTQLTGWNVLQSQARGLASTKPASAGSTTMTWTPAGSQTSYIWAAVAVPILPTCEGTRYTLTVNTDGNGSVTLNPPGGSYCSGRTVMLTPVPNSGYYFSYWSGTDAGDVDANSGVYTIVIDGNKSVAANFTNTPSCQDVSLNASADTYLSGAATTTNYGNAVTLQVDGSTTTATQRTTLLKWNVGSIPSNAAVTSASIVLNVSDTSTVGYPLYDVAKLWVEGDGAAGSGATWATYDGSTTWGTAGVNSTTGNIDRGTVNLWSASSSSFTALGPSTVSLTTAGLNAVKRWVAGGSNNGVVILQYSGSSATLYFDSREAAIPPGTGIAPKLNINYCLGTPASFTVTFDPNGGTGTMSPQTASTPTALTLNAFTREGHTFSGWNTQAGGGGTAYADGATYPFSANATLYAQWTAVTGTIIVEKQTTPDGVSNLFIFTGDAAGTIADGGQIVVSNLQPGAYHAQETVPANWTLTQILCNDANSVGDLPNFEADFQLEAGETVKCTFYNLLPLDYGDAPDPTYPTLLASNGARHIIVAGHSLGPTIDAELDGQPSVLADGDDLNPAGTDDEDGLLALPPFSPGAAAAPFQIDGGPSGGMLDAWIDFDGNGVFDHPAEHLWGGTSWTLGAGVHTLYFAVPATALPGPTYARFRLSTSGGQAPTGLAYDGEVEDYRVQIQGVTCYALTLGHTGNGTTPVAAPANSTGCPAGQYVSGENIGLSGAAADTGWGIASWNGTSNDTSKASSNSLVMPASAHAAGVNYLRLLGDVNVDGLVNSTDALIVLTVDAGLPAAQFCPMNYGDVNGDGYVNSTDALIILTFDAGLSVPFAVGQPAAQPVLVSQPPGCGGGG